MFAGRIYADFQNLDDENRVRLTTAGTQRDLTGRIPAPGEVILLYADDSDDEGRPDPLLAEGRVEYDEGNIPVVRVRWADVQHASDKLAILKKRFFDTAVGDMLRALDGGALIGAVTLGMCVLDHLGFLQTCRGTADDFKGIVNSYLKPHNAVYDADWLWEVRNGLAHVHGLSKKMCDPVKGLDGVIFTHAHPERHLTPYEGRLWLNVESFVSDVIGAAWEAFEDFKRSPERPLEAQPRLLIVLQSDTAADKPYGKMHHWLTRLDEGPPQRELLIAEIGKSLRERARTDRLSA